MRTALIRPTTDLRVVGDISTLHLVLAQHILGILEYREYYKEKVEQGDTVILDNGVYEGVSLTPNELMEAYMLLRPTYLVLPDLMEQGRNSLEVSMKFLRYFRESGCQGKVIGLPQFDNRKSTPAKGLAEWISCFDAFNKHPDVDVIGIVKNLSNLGITREYVMFNVVKAKKVKKPLQLFGASRNDGILEPLLYNKFPHEIMGIDSSYYYRNAICDTPPSIWSFNAGGRKDNFFDSSHQGEDFTYRLQQFIRMVECVETGRTS